MAAFFFTQKFKNNRIFAKIMIRRFTLLFSLFICIGCLSASNQEVPFKLYPNPVTGDILQVNFDFDFKPSQVYTFVVTNVIGQVVFTHILSDEEVKRGSFSIRIDEIKLDKGVYLSKMINGDQSSVQKLVVR
jgi:hypothetical protein